MISAGVAKGHGADVFRVYLAVALSVFCGSFLVGVSSKLSNNLFYVFVGVPVVVFMLFNPRDLWRRVKPLKWLLLFLLLAALSEFVSVDGDAFRGVKYSLYLFVFAASLTLVADDARCPAAILLCFCAVGMVVAAMVVVDWVALVRHAEALPRAVFNEVNPTRTALLLLMAFLGLWLFAVEPRLESIGAGWGRALGLSILVVSGVLVFVMFQSRSTLVSLVLFLLVYASFRGFGRYVLFAVGVSAVILWLSGWYEVVLLRGTSYRTEIWSDALARYLAECSVVFGCGTGGDHRFAGEFANPHSGYLANLYYYGVLATAAFGVMAVVAFRDARRRADKWFLLSIPGWGGALASSSGFINSPGPYWVYFWMPLILSMHYCSRPAPAAVNGTARSGGRDCSEANAVDSAQDGNSVS